MPQMGGRLPGGGHICAENQRTGKKGEGGSLCETSVACPQWGWCGVKGEGATRLAAERAKSQVMGS